MAGRTYDPAARRRTQRRGRERGCWVYVAREELDRAGYPADEAAPFYRTWGLAGLTVIVKLYREG